MWSPLESYQQTVRSGKAERVLQCACADVVIRQILFGVTLAEKHHRVAVLFKTYPATQYHVIEHKQYMRNIVLHRLVAS